jgi:hypothetical protein
MKIITKFTEYVQTTLKKLKSRKYDKMTMKVVLFYLFFIILLLATWYVAWMFMFLKNGIADLDAMSKFIVICTGATGFFGFIMECFVDKNHNGIPDMFEKEKPSMPPPVIPPRPMVERESKK